LTHTEVLTLPDVVKANSTSKCTAKPLVDTHKIIAESWYRCCIFMGAPTCFISEGIPFTRQDYFELVDWTGRTLREDKRGAIDSQFPPILQRLGIQPENWIDSVSHFQKHFFDAAGTLSSLEQFRERKNRQRSEQGYTKGTAEWMKGKRASKRLYG